jgi:hypothetical protein
MMERELINEGMRLMQLVRTSDTVGYLAIAIEDWALPGDIKVAIKINIQYGAVIIEDEIGIDDLRLDGHVCG